MKLARCLAPLCLALLAACGNNPPVPDWQLNARGAMDRYVHATLSGDARVAELEFARARAALASTGQSSLVARAELLRCATQVASLVLQPCTGFEALRQDAAAPERAYASYLAGRLPGADATLLPQAQRAAAVLGGPDTAVLQAMADPLARLVAAGVLLQKQLANDAVIALAVDTASHQGWRRPLLAWLGLQAQRAEAAGATDTAARLRRRMALVAPPP